LLQIGFPNSVVSFSSALGPIGGQKNSAFIIDLGGQIEKIFSISALGLISTVAPIGMLDLGWT
jgi:hypothetical protein